MSQLKESFNYFLKCRGSKIHVAGYLKVITAARSDKEKVVFAREGEIKVENGRK